MAAERRNSGKRLSGDRPTPAQRALLAGVEARADLHLWRGADGRMHAALRGPADRHRRARVASVRVCTRRGWLRRRKLYPGGSWYAVTPAGRAALEAADGD